MSPSPRHSPDVSQDEIESALDFARADVERAIAGVRLGIVGVMSVAIVVALATGNMPSRLPVIYEAALFINALLLFLYLRRRAAVPRGVTLWAALFDLSSGPLFFALVPSPSGQERALADGWYFFMLPAQLFLFLAVAQLRPSRLVAALCTSAAVVLFWACLLTRTSGHPAMPLTTVFVLCAGAVAWYAAHRQRRTLELFARLQLLKRYLPPAAVKRVLEKRTSMEALALGGQKVTLTIMATDLRGFTAMSENLSPEEVVAQLNAYHGVMVEQIDRHGGSLDKFIGDGALAVFGFLPSGPAAPDAGSAAAIACARSMMDALLNLNESRRCHGLPPLRMGIGVHTGDVVAGNIGAIQKRLEFTVIGDTVNTATRLESVTEDLGVIAVASSATVGRIDDKRELRALPPVKLEGKAEPVALYAIDPMP